MPEKAKSNAAQPQPVNPLDVKGQEKKKKEEPGLIEGIVSTETGEGGQQLLEEAPEVDVSLLKEIAPPKSILLLILKVLFAIVAVASFASYIFFTSQLTDRFDFIASKFGIPNISKELKSSNNEVKTLKTNVNFYRYLQIKGFLDEFSFHGDSYLQNFEIAGSQTAENADKKEAVDELVMLRDNLRENFMSIKDKIVQDFTAPLIILDQENEIDLNGIFEQQLISKLRKRAESLEDSTDPQAKREYKNYTQTINLIGNTEFRNLIVQTDFDALSERDLYLLIKKLNDVVVNDLSIIQETKEARVKWSDIINEIELRTIAVDSYYSENFYEEIGGIRYISYDFDITGPSISIIGETKRFDTTNFTMIANLIDELNRSPMFKNAEMRSFTKSGSTETGYTASLNLNLDLQMNEISMEDENIPLEEFPEFVEE
ncbi:hypothetical protein GF366_02720 [Candidatus Peregrinibacteria bacterium]|nr:hypothetical protein [Candidatus Peregrinibacteria bacterium]